MRRTRFEYLGVCAFVCALATGTMAILGAQSAVPTPWLAIDVGAPSPAGTSSYSSLRFTLSAGGEDIWNNSDQFRFVYQPISGDVDLIARVDSLAQVDSWSKAGVMIRADLSASSAHAFAMVSGANGVRFQRRVSAGASSLQTPGESAQAPRWLRLKRVGTTVTGYSSADGGTWLQIDSATIALGQSALVGFAVTSHKPGSAATAVFSQASVTGVASTPLPSGQQTRDIGAPKGTGSASYSGGTYTVAGGGADIWGSSDQFRYVYQPVTGDVDLAVHVASLQNLDPWTKAGVMVRESLNANSRHAMALVSTGQGYSFQWRLDNGGMANFVGGGGGAAPTWVRLVRTGFWLGVPFDERHGGTPWASRSC
jgi:hypothetical protein